MPDSASTGSEAMPILGLPGDLPDRRLGRGSLRIET